MCKENICFWKRARHKKQTRPWHCQSVGKKKVARIGKKAKTKIEVLSTCLSAHFFCFPLFFQESPMHQKADKVSPKLPRSWEKSFRFWLLQLIIQRKNTNTRRDSLCKISITRIISSNKIRQSWLKLNNYICNWNWEGKKNDRRYIPASAWTVITSKPVV